MEKYCKDNPRYFTSWSVNAHCTWFTTTDTVYDWGRNAWKSIHGPIWHLWEPETFLKTTEISVCCQRLKLWGVVWCVITEGHWGRMKLLLCNKNTSQRMLLCVPDLARYIIPINIRLLQIICRSKQRRHQIKTHLEEHVQTPLILGKWVAWSHVSVIWSFSQTRPGEWDAPAILLTKASRADLRSSMNPSSYMPSSLRKGICLFNALLGRGGTTIFEGFVR